MQLVDSTGATECFTAAFAVGMLENRDVEASLDFANKSAMLCASKNGAAMPSREEVESLFAPETAISEESRELVTA